MMHRTRYCIPLSLASLFSIVVLLAACTTPRALAAAPASTPTATIGSTAQQTIAGFGASGDWWTNDLYYFPQLVQQQVARLLFTDEGIAMSQYRYNIGGGGVGVTVSSGDESQFGATTRAPATFFVSPNTYDWSHNPGGTTFLLYAGQYHVPQITAHVNSAPPYFTTNNLSCGGSLNSSEVQAYADYLATVVQHIHDVWHTTISSVSPMNEPDYTRSDCTQEGMAISPALRATVVQDLAATLAKQAPYAHVIADESSQVGSQFLKEESAWLPQSASNLQAIATHTYDFPGNATLNQLGAVVQQYHLPYWATEICCYNGSGFGAQYDPTIVNALWMANTIAQDLTQANASAFDWWVALSAALGCDPATQASCATTINTQGYNDGLIYYDPNFLKDHDFQLYLTKRFWVLGNFSRFVRPGAVRYVVSGAPTNLEVLAFQSGFHWQVVVINNAAAGVGNTTFQLQFPGGKPIHPTGAYQTSATANLSPVALPVAQTGGSVTISVPAQSITTYLF
jgi:O-glycosyl hydrolase